MLNLYETVLGLKFIKSSDKFDKWHEDVQAIEVYESETNEYMGLFFLDLFPRDGKYTHAACFPLHPGFQDGDKREYPVAGMVANFSKPYFYFN